LQNQRKEHGFSPSVRIGLHVAEATSDVQGYTGMGVHHAARIGAAAGAGEVLASREVLEAASIDRETSQTHELELKGISELTTVVSVVC
jgi:class 3 adenylate cyclase